MNNLKIAFEIATGKGYSATYSNGLVLIKGSGLEEIIDERVWDKLQELKDLYRETEEEVNKKVRSKLFKKSI